MSKFRTQLMLTAAYTPLVIGRTLWDYHNGKNAGKMRESPIAITDDLKKAVSAVIVNKQTT